MNTVTSLFKKHFGGRDKVSREHPGVMEYLREINDNIKKHESMSRIAYCAMKLRCNYNHDQLYFYPSIPVPAPDPCLPDLFYIAAVQVSPNNQLFVYDYNGEPHEVTANNAPVIDALYNQLKKIAR